MRLALFVGLLLTCLAFTKAHDLRYTKAQEFLAKYPILIKQSAMIDIVENENFSLFPPKQTQDAQPGSGGKKVVTGKDGKPHVVTLA